MNWIISLKKRNWRIVKIFMIQFGFILGKITREFLTLRGNGKMMLR